MQRFNRNINISGVPDITIKQEEKAENKPIDENKEDEEPVD